MRIFDVEWAMSKSTRSTAAFSLVELMIAVTVIGILASLSVASYGKYKIKAKVAEANQFIANIQKAQSTYLLDNGTYRTLSANPTTLIPEATNQIELQDSWTAIGSPIPVGAKTYWGYAAIAGYVDGSSTEYEIAADGTSAVAGGYTFGPHPTSGSGTCPSTSDPADVGLTLSDNINWVLIIATADFIDDGGSCSLLFQTLIHDGASTLTSPQIQVNVGE